ncbi:MAG: hypothetical protein LC135_01805 [Phycisphaerae bacterium]|nr:hypothetical protein [Phycisphaerae bacterium]MCZ2398588.1 hypothetical protein [Phycisphaerae bacterium]
MPTFPTWAELGQSAAEALSGATDAPSGVRHVAKGTGPASTPSLYSQMVNQQRKVLHQLVTNLRCARVGTLSVGVAPGRWTDPNGDEQWYDGSAENALSDDATNYVYILAATGELVVNTSGFPAEWHTYVPLAVYACAAGAIVTADWLADRRWLLMFDLYDTASAVTGTNSPTWTLGQDNEDAGANQQIRFNRGSSNAEDAAIEWDETNERLNMRAQHDTETLAAANVAGLQVGGVDVIGADGDLEAASLATDQLYTVGANGTTPNGLRLMPAGSPGAPADGAHAVGELHVDSAGVLHVCVSAGTPGTWRRVAKQDDVVVPSVGNGAGSAGGALSFTIQLQDAGGANLAASHLLRVRLMADADGAADAPNTSSVSATVGDIVRVLAADVDVICRTNASGVLTLSVTNSIAGTVYVLVEPAAGSPLLDCRDTGLLVWS